MSEPSQPNHWAKLAEDLGAKVERAPEPAKPAAAAPPPPRRVPEAARPAPRQAADWSQLAANLGATPSQAAFTSAAPKAPPRPAPQPPQHEPPRRREEPSRSHSPQSELPPRAELPPRTELPEMAEANPRVEFTVPDVPVWRKPERPSEVVEVRYHDAEETVEMSVTLDSEESAAPTEEQGERKSGKRRRRRRRGRGRSGEGRNAPVDRETPELDRDAEETSAEEDDVVGEDRDANADGPGESETPATGREERRPRRRRRRRGGRRSGSEAAEGASAPSEQEPEEAVRGYSADLGDAEDDDHFDTSPQADEDAGDDDDVDLKAHHRGVPTWDEAIGMIVATNLESRARNPNGSANPRGRHGHNRGRSHGR